MQARKQAKDSLGFETQGRRHQKSNIGAPQKGLMPSKLFLKIQTDFNPQFLPQIWESFMTSRWSVSLSYCASLWPPPRFTQRDLTTREKGRTSGGRRTLMKNQTKLWVKILQHYYYLWGIQGFRSSFRDSQGNIFWRINTLINKQNILHWFNISHESIAGNKWKQVKYLIIGQTPNNKLHWF